MLCAAQLALPMSAWPQSQPATQGRPPVVDGKAAPASPTAVPADAPYVDRLIGGGELAPLPPEGESSDYNAEGWPRYVRVEAVASSISGSGGSSRQNGIRFTGLLDTPNHGALSADATLQSGGGTNTVTVAQRAMPFDGGWRANNTLGVTYTPSIDLTRSQYRFFVPTFPFFGATTEWLRTNELQLQGAVGRPGNFGGVLVPGFDSLGGTLAMVGGQWNMAPEWRAGFELLSAEDVNLALSSNDPTNRFSGQSFYGSVGWQAGDSRVQGNLLNTQANNGRSGLGLWIDGRTRVGRYTHHYGVYRFEPNLYFGYQQVNSDQQGAYYRINYHSQKWLWDATVEGLSSVSGNSPDTGYVSGSLSYLVDRSLSVGVSGALRHSSNTSWSTQSFVEKISRYGTSRLQFSAAVQDRQNDAEQLQFDHSWIMAVGARLSTGAAISRQQTADGTFNTVSLLVYGGGNLTDQLTLDGNARVNYALGGGGFATYINANATWTINSHWSVVATAYDNRDDTAKQFVITSPSQDFEPLPVQRSRAFFLTVRYENRAGRATSPLGGALGSGSGSIVGYVFLDANGDGRRNADETGAANVTVLLDGRFAVRTDQLGRFEFPQVGGGAHSLSVISDNLPLPWSIAEDGRREIVVRTRDTLTLEIPATRLK